MNVCHLSELYEVEDEACCFVYHTRQSLGLMLRMRIGYAENAYWKIEIIFGESEFGML